MANLQPDEAAVSSRAAVVSPGEEGVEVTASSFSHLVEEQEETPRDRDLTIRERKAIEKEMRRARAVGKLMAGKAEADLKAKAEAKALLAKQAEVCESLLTQSHIAKLRKLCLGVSDEEFLGWVYSVCERNGLDAKKRAAVTEQYLVFTAIQLTAELIQRNWRRHRVCREMRDKEAAVKNSVGQFDEFMFTWSPGATEEVIKEKPKASTRKKSTGVSRVVGSKVDDRRNTSN